MNKVKIMFVCFSCYIQPRKATMTMCMKMKHCCKCLCSITAKSWCELIRIFFCVVVYAIFVCRRRPSCVAYCRRFYLILTVRFCSYV